ncbi:phage portal protein [Mammaliicoccus sp. F-M27]|uniref:phage portal protein n=1 Tax=Mammaliicoccus sp. F-M27 TaxID=2898687 RepID=UPI001EFBE342|nr:phage portal protein [Mammaliicoccus sp. F-M27]
MGFLDSVFNRNKMLDWSYDLDLIEDNFSRIHLKKLAIQICINKIANTISQSKFEVISTDKKLNDNLVFLLNHQANKNMNSTRFWQNVVYKLIYDNEVLIIKSDDDEFIIADDFEQVEYAVYENMFKHVIVKDFEFNRTFKMSEVIYLEYSNEEMSGIINGLFDDYGSLFGRLVDYQMHANQIRATMPIKMIGGKSEEQTKRVQSYVDKLTSQFRNNSLAIVPLQDGMEYKEHSTSSVKTSTDDIDKVLNGYIEKVAAALNIPTVLIKGDMADTKEATKNFMRFGVNPILKQITDEFNIKFFEKEKIIKGEGIFFQPMSTESVFERAESIDKLVASGTFTRNEIRVKLGEEKADDPELDKYLITKNYQSVDAVEGGEKE